MTEQEKKYAIKLLNSCPCEFCSFYPICLRDNREWCYELAEKLEKEIVPYG